MDFVIDLREKYLKVRKYLEDDSKRDPDSEPFRSKYKAMDILKEMKAILEDKLRLETDDEQFQSMLAVVILQMGIICVDTAEISKGQQLLEDLMTNLKAPEDPKRLLVAISCLNQLGIVSCHLGNTERAKEHLEQAEKLYVEFRDDAESVLSLHDHFDSTCEISGTKGSEELEKVHTLTKFYLAQVYGALGDNLKSAIYCHETLRRQLESKSYDPIDWALNAATLSQFFMEKLMFKQARHHLVAASYIMDRYIETLGELELSDEELEAKKEEIKYRGADISRCWAKYGIALLEQSALRLNGLEIEIVDEPLEDEQIFKKLWFHSLELAELENQIPFSYCVEYEDARNLMVTALRHLNSAKEYYLLEDHASDYVKIIQDHSTLLRHLSAFETDQSRVCKMLRKRITLLEEVLKELNPRYYLDFCRQLWFELGEAYHDLMHNKSEKITSVDGTPPAVLTKFNKLREKSMENFQHFLNSLRDKTTNELPAVYSDDLAKPALMAHFYLARLVYKLITPDKRVVLENTKTSRNYFNYVIDYCKNHPEQAASMSEELRVAEDMANLMDIRLKQNLLSL